MFLLGSPGCVLQKFNKRLIIIPHPSMAATASLLKANCCSLFVHRDSRPLKWRRNHPTTTQIPLLLQSIKKTPTTGGGFTVQCVMNNNSKNYFMEDDDDDDDEEERKRNHQHPLNKRFAEVMMLSGILFLAYDPYSSAIAASGGRMGGSDSSSSSSYSSSPSSSYSSSDDDDHSSSPSYSFSISSPTSSTHSMDKSGSISESWPFFLFLIAYLLFCGITSTLLESWKGSTRSTERNTLTNNTQQTTTVLKLQVGLTGMKRSLQRALDRIAETVADTSTSKGLSYILRETTSLLPNHPACCISGYSSVNVKQSIEDGEKLFNRLCIEERGKFDEETLVNVDNVKRQNASSKGANVVNNEYMVITILVAAKGVHKLPTINGSANLKEALQKLGSISSNKTMASLEVLWTPQKENDTLTEQELREDYPLLRPLYKDQDTQPLEK